MADLITLARAKMNIPSVTDASQDATIAMLITAASRAVERYTRRDFTRTAYDELYNGSGDRRLILRQFPVVSVQAVRYRPVTAFKVTNTLNTNQQARVAVTSTGLTLVRKASGVAATDAVAFAANVTLDALAAAVNALGNGWSAQAVGDYGPWPAADLRAPQGALNAVSGVFAELKMHTFELSGFQIDELRGWLLRAIPYTDPELLHPEDLIWPVGINNFRIQYTAGFDTVPEDVQEATAELTATFFAELGRDQAKQSENTASTYHYTAFIKQELPRSIKQLLAPYRNYRAFNNQG